MASTSPSPGSSPSSVPPVSSNPVPDSPVSQPDQATGTPPPPDTPSTSAPPLQLPPLPVATSPPPSPPQSPPTDASSPPPPDLPASPPPSPPATTPPPLPPPVTATPPPASSPPPPDPSPPPPDPSPPPPDPSPPPPDPSPPPPPSAGSPPPEPTPSPPPPLSDPASSPPSPSPPAPISPSPPPPADVPSPPVSASPPPPRTNPPENSPPRAPAPPTNTSINPPSSTSSPPPSSTPTNPSTPPTSQLPPPPTEKPTARSTDTTTNFTQNGGSGGSRGGPKTGGVIAIGLVVTFVTLSLFILAVWFRKRQKRRGGRPTVNYIMPSPSASSQKSDAQFLSSQQSAQNRLAGSPSVGNSIYSPEAGGVGNSRHWFTYEELSQATDGFSGSNLLGEGGFGCVYKGFLTDGREVAVKQLKIGGGQGEREFRAEVEIISRVHHRHLVSLVGYCIDEHQRLLVYQFVPNDTLHYHLHGEGRPVMEWSTRIRVAAGAARGLAYLHEDCHPRIIHRDIKSSNILLDDNFDAQVADFGLAKLAMDSNTHVTTRVMGTFGYMAPEYASSGKLTEKSDVFSFGVVLLELITGRKPVDGSQPLGDESLVEWARPLLNKALEHEDFEELVDPRLEKNYMQVEMFRMIEAAAACIRHLAPKRPRMSQVVRALDSIVEFTTDLSNGMKPGQSEIFDSREQSAQIRLFQRMAFGSQDYSSEFYNNSQSSWRS